MKKRILSALKSIPVAQLDRDGWLRVGMALKEEGYDPSVWDEWSKDDTRYHEGECQRIWDFFNGSASPVTGGTIIQLAQSYGWKMPGQGESLDWDSEIEYDGYEDMEDISTLPQPDFSELAEQPVWDPVAQLKLYLQLLFRPDEHVEYVTTDCYLDPKDNKYRPKVGPYDRTAAELISELEKHPDDIGAVIGDWTPEAGAWIQFNPVDGKGVSLEHITSFRFTLLECDHIPKEDQIKLFREHQFPIKVMVDSGGKSVHCLVFIDAKNEAEYRKRVQYLYKYCVDHGIPVDPQNKNASRKSRMPGVTRNGNRQYIIATNIGKKTWADWVEWVEGDDEDDDLPDIEYISDCKERPEPPEEQIEGILTRGSKMMIVGGSKAGKSMLLMQLSICIAEGLPWLGFQCKKGKVLYVNLELKKETCENRFWDIYDAMGLERDRLYQLAMLNLRGKAEPLDRLAPKIIRRARGRGFDAIIIDPIYKVLTGDENSASAMAEFVNNFDKICTETGCSVITSHHHSKGAQGGKKSMDRASGSGVFARDADALLDMGELELSEDIKRIVGDKAKAFRVESTLREFAEITPVDLWYSYPIHHVDNEGILSNMGVQGSSQAGRTKNKKNKTTEQAAEEFREAFEACSHDGSASVDDMAAYLGQSTSTVYERRRRLKDEYGLDNHTITKIKSE